MIEKHGGEVIILQALHVGLPICELESGTTKPTAKFIVGSFKTI